METNHFLCPLSSTQEDFAVFDEFFPDNFLGPGFAVAAGFHIEGNADLDRLQLATTRGVALHESLHAYFRRSVHGIQQYFNPESHVMWIDFPESNDRDLHECLMDLHFALCSYPLSPFEFPLVAANITQIGPTNVFFGLKVHHMILDGNGLNRLLKDIWDIYSGENPTATSYISYCMAQYNLRSSEQHIIDRLNYWTQAFSSRPNLFFPCDRASSSDVSHGTSAEDYSEGALSFDLDEVSVASIENFRRTQHLYWFPLYLTSFVLVKAAVTDSDCDLSVTTGSQIGLEEIGSELPIGLTLRLFPVIVPRSILELSVGEIAREVQKQWLLAWKNADIPLNVIVGRDSRAADSFLLGGESTVPVLFQVMPERSEGPPTDSFTVTPIQRTIRPGMKSWGLEVDIHIGRTIGAIDLHYDPQQFSNSNIEDIGRRFQITLNNIPQRLDLTGSEFVSQLFDF